MVHGGLIIEAHGGLIIVVRRGSIMEFLEV